MSHLRILLVLLVLVFTPALSELCNPEDKQILLRIKKELGNPSNLSSWLPTTDCCGNWVGVSCATHTQPNRVNVLDLSDLHLRKPYLIPPSITDLPYLQYLYITNSDNIVGTLPPTFTKLTHLRRLHIRFTNVSGHIPDFLSQMKSLEYILLSNSKFSGTLPTWLPSLPKLTGISIEGNRISGAIPDSFGSFSKVFKTMTLTGNRLTGKIPATLGKLDLEIVDLSDNMLEGDASMLFGSKKHTQLIHLTNNKFSFDFGKVGLSKTLKIIEVSNNRLYGTLPKGLLSLNDLRWLNVSHNNLCGEIPQGGGLKYLHESSYAHNKCLCGSPLPSCKRF
ncbi:hypothetical protein VNO78_11435 [Psophocarpus tetragonolobus]|uniref:Leucine-rich repeat-containing N-terminal plant-type domain-containing protein n=1 Tax=Psophocarpus tetragonolobus TaxID=3891 RepID=A0AAN9STP0_PSOTE